MSIKSIADKAGTSVATVSRILNNPDYQCHDRSLNERVWAIARQEQYVPNNMARNLRKGTSRRTVFTIDVFLTRFKSIQSDAFFEEIYSIIRDEILSSECALGEFYTSVDIMNILQTGRGGQHIPYRSDEMVAKDSRVYGNAVNAVDKNRGLIILGKCPVELISTLQGKYRYIVGIDRNPTEYLYDEVVCDGAKAAEMAVEYLISKGYRDIAYIGDCTYEARYVGYYQTLIKNRLQLNYSNVYPSDQTEEEGYKTALKIIESSSLPAAIFCANDMTAIGVLRAFAKKKNRPAIISIDNLDRTMNIKPMLTTIDIPKKEMGHLAVKLLIDKRDGGHENNIRIELPCKIVERESV